MVNPWSRLVQVGELDKETHCLPIYMSFVGKDLLISLKGKFNLEDGVQFELVDTGPLYLI